MRINAARPSSRTMCRCRRRRLVICGGGSSACVPVPKAPWSAVAAATAFAQGIRRRQFHCRTPWRFAPFHGFWVPVSRRAWATFLKTPRARFLAPTVRGELQSLENHVIPAKAGIQMDPRLRGDDEGLNLISMGGPQAHDHSERQHGQGRHASSLPCPNTIDCGRARLG